MAEATGIEWTDATFNPWIGCTRVSPACDNCYAAVSTPARALGVQWGAGHERRRTSSGNWALPLRWNRQHADFEREHGRRRRVFCASLADVFDNSVDPAWRNDLWLLIHQTPNLDWLLLTKRIGNVASMLPVMDSRLPGYQPWSNRWPWHNVWLGATIANQLEADRDIPKLLATPAAKRFLSIEPLLGPVDLCEVLGIWWNSSMGCFESITSRINTRFDGSRGIDWVIVGGESGQAARSMHPGWVRTLRRQCAAADVPFLFKQWGEWRPPNEGEEYNTANGRAQKVPAFIVSPSGTVHCFENPQWTDGGEVMLRVGKKAAGRTLDGVLHDGYPAVRP